MSKSITMLTAGVLALALSGFAYAADEPQPGTQNQQQGDTAKREQEYLTALKRCESLSAADKQKCIEAAKKKYGEM